MGKASIRSNRAQRIYGAKQSDLGATGFLVRLVFASHGQQFFKETANLALSVDEMNLQNPVRFWPFSSAERMRRLRGPILVLKLS